VPEHPTVETGVVDRLLLRFDLLRAVLRLAERERLNPGPNMLGRGDSQLVIALARGID